MTSNKFLNSIYEKNHSSPPIWLMRQAGRYMKEYMDIRKTVNNIMDIAYNSNLISEITMQPIVKFDLDAAIIFSDILVIPDILGVKIEFTKNEGPRLFFNKDLKYLEVPNNFNMFLPIYDAISNVRNILPKNKSLIGFAGSPWTLATYIIEGMTSKTFQKSKIIAYTKPNEFQYLINILTETISKHLIKQIEAGVNAIQLFDSWSNVLDKDNFYKWVIEPTRKIVLSIKEIYPNIPIIGFPRACGIYYKDFTENTLVDVISIDSNLTLDWVIKNINKDITIQGNMDPIYLLSDDKRYIDMQIEKILFAVRDRKFIFNLGHGVLQDTLVENVDYLVKKIRSF